MRWTRRGLEGAFSGRCSVEVDGESFGCVRGFYGCGLHFRARGRKKERKVILFARRTEKFREWSFASTRPWVPVSRRS